MGDKRFGDEGGVKVHLLAVVACDLKTRENFMSLWIGKNTLR